MARTKKVFQKPKIFVLGTKKVRLATNTLVARTKKVSPKPEMFVFGMSKVFLATNTLVAKMNKVFRATNRFAALQADAGDAQSFAAAWQNAEQ